MNYSLQQKNLILDKLKLEIEFLKKELENKTENPIKPHHTRSTSATILKEKKGFMGYVKNFFKK